MFVSWLCETSKALRKVLIAPEKWSIPLHSEKVLHTQKITLNTIKGGECCLLRCWRRMLEGKHRLLSFYLRVDLLVDTLVGTTLESMLGTGFPKKRCLILQDWLQRQSKCVKMTVTKCPLSFSACRLQGPSCPATTCSTGGHSGAPSGSCSCWPCSETAASSSSWSRPEEKWMYQGEASYVCLGIGSIDQINFGS